MSSRQSNYKTIGEMKDENPETKKNSKGPPLLKEELEEAMRNYTVICVDVWAPWCAPCKKMAPLYDRLAKLYVENSSIIFLKDNIDHPDSFHKEKVTSIPTFFIYYLPPGQQLIAEKQQNHAVQKIQGGDITQVQEMINRIIHAYRKDQQ